MAKIRIKVKRKDVTSEPPNTPQPPTVSPFDAEPLQADVSVLRIVDGEPELAAILAQDRDRGCWSTKAFVHVSAKWFILRIETHGKRFDLAADQFSVSKTIAGKLCLKAVLGNPLEPGLHCTAHVYPGTKPGSFHFRVWGSWIEGKAGGEAAA